MTLTGRQPTTPTSDSGAATPSSATGVGTLAVVVLGLTAGAIYRQGAFYPLDAFGLVVVAVPLVLAGLARNRDRHAATVVVATGGLALWWLVRSIMERSPVAFLPLGASVLGFVAAFLIVRDLGRAERSRLSIAVVGLGAIVAAAGLTGLLLRAHPLARSVGGIWRLSTTLTYPAGAAVLFIVALLVAMSLDLGAPLARAAVCLCLAGLIGTQSHWDLVALACGIPFVPWRRWPEAAWPLLTGSVAGLVVVATSAGPRPTWLPCALVVASVGASMVGGRSPRTGVRQQLAVAGVVVAAGLTIFSMVHPPVGAATGQPVDQSQTLAWSASYETWHSSVLTGVGPPRIQSNGDPVDSYPAFVPDVYLTVLADGGVIGALLLVGAGAAVIIAIRRRDLLSSCATAGVVAFAVAGAVDFDWQLPALALFGGCVAGLASMPARPSPETTPHPRIPGAGTAVAGWVAVVVVVMVAQLAVGANQTAGGAVRARTTPPPPSATPESPGQIILRGPEDATDPFMLKTGGRYYLYASEGTTFMNVPLRTGRRPGQWGPPVDVLPHLPAWAEGGLTWAPDVHQVAGGWALYFSSLLKGVSPYTHCIGSAFSRSPAGPFIPTDRPFVCQRDHRGSIDARVFVEAGNHLVLLWKSEDNANPSVPGPDQNGYTGIYAQNLSADGRQLLGQPVKIFAPSEPWEGTIVEAPDMIEEWGTYWLFFSGNWYYSASYGIGVAACQSPFGPCSDPGPGPFLGSNDQGAGPGEESLFRDGSNIYLLYNPFRANDPGPVIPRPVAMTRLGFTPKGPYLAAP